MPSQLAAFCSGLHPVFTVLRADCDRDCTRLSALIDTVLPLIAIFVLELNRNDFPLQGIPVFIRKILIVAFFRRYTEFLSFIINSGNRDAGRLAVYNCIIQRVNHAPSDTGARIRIMPWEIVNYLEVIGVIYICGYRNNDVPVNVILRHRSRRL